LAQSSRDLIVLCEGDMTFRAKDLDKLLAYIDHADIVNGTRIVEQLCDYSAQLSTLMYYGNFFVGKLLELKRLRRGTFTDVGTTYKLVRRNSLERLLPIVNPGINLEFNVHFLDTALATGERVVECPITFHPRVGVSAGYGHFINQVSAKKAIALDTWAGFVDHLRPGIETHVGDVTDLSFVPSSSIDFVFASNLFEHITQENFGSMLIQLRRVLTPGGTLNIVQPNYYYLY
jgi:SAM-dependent methyltransferase